MLNINYDKVALLNYFFKFFIKNMSKKQDINFYTTFGCHLCEQVESMIFTLNQQRNLSQNYEIFAFDIIDDEKIFEEYRTVIPVLEKKNSGEKLFWPFTIDELNLWLR